MSIDNQQKKLSTLFSPSRTTLYCTISVPLKSQDAYNSASRPYANAVGYAQSTLQNGCTMVTPQFLNIGSSGAVPLQTLKPTGEDTSDNVYIQTLDAAGRTVDNYAWNDWANDEACWVDDNYAPVEGVSFAAGQGLWVQGLAEAQGIQSAGKVGGEDVSVTLRNGCTAAGNPFPVEIDLQDILAVGEDTSDNVYIQTLDAAGRTVDSYAWNDWATDEPCWVDDSYTKVEGVKFTPGQGLWIQGLSESQSIRFTAPEL